MFVFALTTLKLKYHMQTVMKHGYNNAVGERARRCDIMIQKHSHNCLQGNHVDFPPCKCWPWPPSPANKTPLWPPAWPLFTGWPSSFLGRCHCNMESLLHGSYEKPLPKLTVWVNLLPYQVTSPLIKPEQIIGNDITVCSFLDPTWAVLANISAQRGRNNQW